MFNVTPDLQVVPLDDFGGLITGASPDSLPEGASPRCYNNDYLIGETSTRQGAESFYTFDGSSATSAGSAAVDIPTESLPWTNPTAVLVNDGNSATVVLGGGQSNTSATSLGSSVGGGVAWINPTNVDSPALFATVSLSPGGSTYTPSQNTGTVANHANNSNQDPPIQTTVLSGFGSVAATSATLNINLSASVSAANGGGAIILEGSVDSGGTWNSLGALTNTSTQTFSRPVSGFTNLNQIKIRISAFCNCGPGGFVNISGSVNSWNAVVATPAGLTAQTLQAAITGLTVPAGATITGLGISFAAEYATTLPAFSVALNVGSTSQTFTLTTSVATYTFGGNGELWGYSAWNASTLASLLVEFSTSASSTSTVSVNNLVLTVFYTSTAMATSDRLRVTGFSGLVLPPTASILGIEAKTYGSGAGITLHSQLVKNGVPVGATFSFGLTSSIAPVITGGQTSLWSSTWLYSDVNNTQFGVDLWVTSSSALTASIDYVTITVYFSQSSQNFTWVGPEDEMLLDGEVLNLAVDAGGSLWLENATTNPGVLTILRTGITPGSHGFGVTAGNAIWMAFSDLTQGIDIPLQYRNGWLDRISQVGPGAPPSFAGSVNVGATGTISAYSASGGVLTLTLSPALSAPYVAGQVVAFTAPSGALAPLDGLSFNVLGTPTPTTSSFAIATGLVTGSGSATATVVPQYTYPIVASPNGITQPPVQVTAQPGTFDAVLWSSGPGSTSTGSVVTIYYLNAYTHPNGQDQTLVNALTSGKAPVYVYVAGTPLGIANGTHRVTGFGTGVPPGGGDQRYYFTFAVNQTGYQKFGSGSGSVAGTYQITQATLTTTLPVPGLTVGNQIVISGAGVSNWNATWTITDTPNAGTYAILQTSMSGGTATYQWALDSGVAPVVGELITVTGTLNGNGIFNVNEALVASVTGTTAGTFTITGFPNQTIAAGAEQGLAEAAGTKFTFDPGAAVAGTSTNPIYGNSGNGFLTVVGGTGQVIGTGTREAVVGFITRDGLWTQPSPFATFTTSVNANYIYASDIPIGPPNVIGRYIAFTEAGQEGVPGANFFVIPQPVTFQVFNTTYLSSATVIYDNTTTTAQFTFTDSVLLGAEAIDVEGNNLFNLIELGNPSAIAMYDTRLFYFLCQNKVQNFINMSFDGGYLAANGTNPVPLGWSIDPNSNPTAGTPATVTAFSISSNVVTITATNTFTVGMEVYITGLSTGTYLNNQLLLLTGVSPTQFTAAFTHADVTTTADSGTATPISTSAQLLTSPVFGNSYYIRNNTGTTQAQLGGIFQTAYQDAYQVPILNPGGIPATYSVRMTLRCPSGLKVGQATVQLVNYTNSGFGTVFGAFSVPFSKLSTVMQTFTGKLLTTAFQTVPPGVVFWAGAMNIGNGGDVEFDRIEVFPTDTPVEKTVVYASYVSRFDSIDGVTGRIECSNQNSQPVVGGTALYNSLYLQKTSSKYVLQSSPNQEPADWGNPSVSGRTGACGIYATASGEQWEVSACRSGLYLFEGGQPGKINHEIFQVWDAINWAAGNSIWVANDIADRHLYVGVPLQTPNFWLPTAPPSSHIAPIVSIVISQVLFPPFAVYEVALTFTSDLPDQQNGQTYTFSGLTLYPTLNGQTLTPYSVSGNVATFRFHGSLSLSGPETGNAVITPVNPITPNVILMLNYQGVDSGEEIIRSAGLHVSMFGDLKSIDMRRKWSIWTIPSPYANFVMRDSLTNEFLLCNGLGNSKIYNLADTNGFDDGTPFTSLYTTYGFVNSAKVQQFPMLGMWRKLYKYLKWTGDNTGTVNVTIYPNQLMGPGADTTGYYPWTVKGGFPPSNGLQDHEAPLNFQCQRGFFEYSTTGADFRLSKMLLGGIANVWNQLTGKR